MRVSFQTNHIDMNSLRKTVEITVNAASGYDSGTRACYLRCSRGYRDNSVRVRPVSLCESATSLEVIEE